MCEKKREGEKDDWCIPHDSKTVINQPKNLGEESKNEQTIKAEKSEGNSAGQSGKLSKNISTKGRSSIGKFKSKDRSYLAIKKALAEARKRKGKEE